MISKNSTAEYDIMINLEYLLLTNKEKVSKRE